MTVGAFSLRPHLRGSSLGLKVIEIVVTPPPGSCITLRVLNGHVGTVVGSREVASAGRFDTRTVRKLPVLQRTLQLLEEYGPLREHSGFFVDIERCRLDINIMKFGKV